MKNFSDKYAVIVLTKNEEETIASVLAFLLSLTKNIIVVDGNSTDRTCQIVQSKNVQIILQKGEGKGSAIQQAIQEIDKELLVFIDADGSHECSDIPKLVEPLLNNGADLVIASRMLGGSDELHGTWNNFIRMAGSSLLAIVINYWWKVHLTDIENGYRAIRRDVALKLDLKANDFTIEQEMVMKAIKKGYRVKEVASHEYERKGGVSKLPTSQGWKFIRQFIKDIW